MIVEAAAVQPSDESNRNSLAREVWAGWGIGAQTHTRRSICDVHYIFIVGHEQMAHGLRRMKWHIDQMSKNKYDGI